jgi:hypothetical protein
MPPVMGADIDRENEGFQRGNDLKKVIDMRADFPTE